MACVINARRCHHQADMKLVWLGAMFLMACGGKSGDTPDGGPPAGDAASSDAALVDAAPDAAPAPDAALPDAAADAAVADAPPDAPSGPVLHIAITGQGEVGVRIGDQTTERCTATCTIAVDPAARLTVSFSTPVEVAQIDGVAVLQSGGLERDYPAGTASISVVFSPRAGEVDLVGDDLAFDHDNNLAIAASGPGGIATVTVYDPAMAPTWSVPGRRVAFTRTGELYVERDQAGDAVTSKYDAAGHLLASATIPLGFVTPDGGMLNPGPASNTITRRDATLTAISVLTLSAPYPGARGCLGMTDTGINATVTHPSDSELSFDFFALDGTYLETRSSNRFSCREVPDWGTGIVQSTFHPHETAASHGSFFVDDLNAGFDDLPYGAGVDLANHLYWMTSGDVSELPFVPQGGSIKQYTPPGTTPVATITRGLGTANAGNVGITPRKLAVAPDGRAAWVVTWYAAFSTGPNLIQIFAP